jgi:acyl-CoA reductase-like NAD-dependent aldehyde dehydrogenase
VQESAAHRFVGTALELGGKCPAYVAEDADVEAAAASVVDGAFYNAGQVGKGKKCSSTCTNNEYMTERERSLLT